MLDTHSRFHGFHPMVQILIVRRRKALRRVVICCVVETLVVLWKFWLVGLYFPMMRRLKCREGVGCERCEGWGRWRCGMGNWGLVGELRSLVGWLGGW